MERIATSSSRKEKAFPGLDDVMRREKSYVEQVDDSLAKAERLTNILKEKENVKQLPLAGKLSSMVKNNRQIIESPEEEDELLDNSSGSDSDDSDSSNGPEETKFNDLNAKNFPGEQKLSMKPSVPYLNLKPQVSDFKKNSNNNIIVSAM